MSESSNLPDKPDLIDVARAGTGTGTSRLRVSHTEYGFSGPLPPPDFLAQYDSAFPGSADRIIRLTESEADHRRAIEREIVAAEISQHVRDSNEARRGQFCAMVIVLASLAAGTYTAMNGHEIAVAFWASEESEV